MSWYKQSLRSRTLEEAQEDYAEANVNDIDYLVSVLVERKRLTQEMMNAEDKSEYESEIQKLKDIWENYPPSLQFFAVNKFRQSRGL